MTAVKQDLESRPRGMTAAWLTLAFAMATTLFAAWRVNVFVERRNDRRFADELASVTEALNHNLGLSIQAVADAADAALADSPPSPEQWSKFIKSLDWRSRFYGLTELGYVAPGRLPEGGAAETLLYLDSSLVNPLHRPGLDLQVEASRRTALAIALARGAPAGTAEPVLLTTAPGAPKYGVVSFAPLLQSRQPGDPGGDDAPNIRGLLLISIDQPRYFQAIAPRLRSSPLRVDLAPAGQDFRPPGPFEREIQMAGPGGSWRFRVTAGPAFYRDSQIGLPLVVLAFGFGVSALLFALVWAESRRRVDAETANAALQRRDSEIRLLNEDLERRIGARTAELRETNSRLMAEAAERAEAQANLARFKAVIDATSDLVAITGLDGKVIYANKAGRMMVGLSEDASPQTFDFRQFYPAWAQKLLTDEAIPAALRHGVWRGEVTLRHLDGHEVPVSIVGLVIRRLDGQPEYMAAIHRDISEQRRTQAELKRALDQEKDLSALKGNFISMVSHEIRTPLALMLSSAEILTRYFDRLPLEKRRRQLDTINQSVRRMSTLVEDVLLFSQTDDGRLDFKPAEIDLPAHCREIAEETESAMGRRCPIIVSARETGGLARVDATLTRHILSNLLSNAVKHSAPDAPVLLEVESDGSEIVFRVKDDGMGIPESDLKCLFTPFYRGRNSAHIPGTGLGLVIVKRCVERHGGAVEIVSHEGVGTTAIARLPKYTPGNTERFNKARVRPPQSTNHETNSHH